MSEPKYKSTSVQRFMRYVTVDTQSDEGSETYPSTAKQLDLLRQLEAELNELGLQEVELDEHGYVMATLPANIETDVPVIAFLAHVDTSPESSGTNVKPILHKDYQGDDVVLPDDPTAVLKPSESAELKGLVGTDIITSSGQTLLGADDKAGVSGIVAAMEVLINNPDIPHGKIRVAFTPDEEVGRGTEHFDVEKLGAKYAYTLDGAGAGELEIETFSADSLTLIFHGFNTHPGYAKGKMINSIRVAADFINRLPKDRLSPETTAGYEGYVHTHDVKAGVEKTEVKLLIRDFVTAELKTKEDYLEKLAQETVAEWPGSSFEVKLDESYRNMKEILDHHPQVVDVARRAIEEAGLAVKTVPIRGGTDGSRLSFMGLPTPNVFAGMHNIHSRLEWASVWEMEKAVEVVVGICRIWAEEGRKG